jgi:hypothetical protein
MPTQDQDLREKGFGLYAPGTQVPPGHMILDRSDGTSWVGPESAFQEKPLGAVEPLGSGVAQYGQMLGQGALSTGRFLAEQGVKSALPTLGGAIGGALGGPVSPLTAAGGAMLGMGANQMLGIEPNLGPTDYLIGGGLAAAPGLIRSVASELPGASVALQKRGQAEALKIPSRLEPPVPARTLFEDLATQKFSVPLRDFMQASAGIAEQLGNAPPAARIPVMKRLDATARQLIDQFGNAGVPTPVLHDTQSLIRTIGQGTKTDVGKAASVRLREALLSDLESAGAGQGSRYAAVYKQAADAYKHELAIDKINDIAKAATDYATGHPNMNFGRIATTIMKDNDIERWLGTAGQQAIAQPYMKLARTVPTIGADVGPGLRGQQFSSRALGGMLGYGIGGPVGAAAGVISTEALTRALASPMGQTIVTGMTARGIRPEAIMQTLGQLGAATIRGNR